jgi:uncharacterized short protein YbdD (DUF466 family)
MSRSTIALFKSSLSRGLGELRYWVREFFGENAYPRYVAAWQARRAGSADGGEEHRLLTAREFFKQRLERTYGGDVQRCCSSRSHTCRSLWGHLRASFCNNTTIDRGAESQEA